MKFLVGLSVLAISAASFGAANSSINDLQYLPNAGTAYGITNAGYVKSSFADGVSTSRTTGYQIDQTVGYAVLNNLSVQANVNYASSEEKERGVATTESKGISDPTIGARYRLIDADNRLDILAAATISLGDAEVKSNGDSDNRLGGHSFDVGAQYGAKKENYQWAVSAIFTRNLKATIDDKSAGAKIKDDAHNGLNFAAELLTKLGEKCFIKTLGGVGFTESYDNNANSTVSPSTVYRLGAEFQHLLSNNVFVKAGFENRTFVSNSINVNVPVYYVGANYQF